MAWIGLIGCVLAAVPALYLLRHGLVGERERLVSGVVESAHGVIAGLQSSVERSELSLWEAQARARAVVALLGEAPFRLTVFTDGKVPEGWPADGHAIVRSMTFERWGWTIAAADGYGDVDRAFLAEALAFILFLGVLLALSWPLSSFLSQNVVGPIEGLSAGMKAVTEGQTDIDVPGLDRADEFGAMARALEFFRHAARALLEREQRLSGIMNNAGEAIVLIADDGRVEQSNPAAARLFGVDPAGCSMVELFAPADRTRVESMLEAARGHAVAEPVRADALAVLRGEQRAELSMVMSRLEVAGRRNYIALASDATERLRHERELLRLATRDRLTGLPNRALVESLLESAIQRGRRFAVLCLDLSRFKLVTDTLGHAAGDLLLLEVARRIQGVVRTGDIVGRVGTDDFAVVLDPVLDAAEAEALAADLIACFHEPVELPGSEHYARPSVGIALYPDHGAEAQELLRLADTALYAAKRQGGRQAAVFRPEMGAQAQLHLALDRDLRLALAGCEFRLHYQPKVSLIDYTLEGFEALLRWERPGKGLVSPSEFIPVAEESGFIVQLGDWVLDEVCRQQRIWLDHGMDPVPVAVNISPRHLRQRGADDFARILERHRVPAELIELEITESAVMHDLDHALAVLGDLKSKGIRVAVDDFGTGHSSLSYLKRLPVTTLKIDRSFIDGVPRVREDSGIVSTIIAMADMLGLDVVAEGVERPEQAHFLRHHNCTLAQGWLTGRPMAADQAETLLLNRLRESA